jgi:tRNA-specific 2-thiouridylase
LGLEPTEPYYVTKIFPETNTIELGQRNDLYQNEMWVENYNIINKSDFETEVITRIRYRKQSAISRVEFINEKLLKVSFIEPEWSIAPGQTAAFYAGDRLLGGGFIKG